MDFVGDVNWLTSRRRLVQLDRFNGQIRPLTAVDTLSRSNPKLISNCTVKDTHSEKANLDFLIPSPFFQFFLGLALLGFGVFFALDRNRTAIFGMALVALAVWMIAHGSIILLRS